MTMDATTFVRAMIERNVLQFGDFLLKSGRRSPYFFNLGHVADGPGLDLLGRAYGAAITRLPVLPDVLFGPAYKGIPIAVAAAVALARQHGVSVGAAFDRKEAKTHGEGGRLVGAAMAHKKVVIVDDVVTDGTAKRGAFETIAAVGGEVVGVVLALDRREAAGVGEATAVEALQRDFGVPVRCVADVDDVLACLGSERRFAEHRQRLLAYRRGRRQDRVDERHVRGEVPR